MFIMKQIKIKRTEHQKQIAEHFQSFFKEKMMCDVTLKAKNYTVEAHKLVLAANSDYFKAMFTGSWSEKHVSEIVLHELTPAGLQAVVEFAYNGEITTDSCENIVEIISAIHHCQIEMAYKPCEKYLVKNIDESNFFDLLAVTELYDLDILRGKLAKFAAKTFMPSFPASDPTSISAVNQLSQDVTFFALVLEKWKVASRKNFHQLTAFKSIVSWANADLENREEHLSSLLSAVTVNEDHIDVADVVRFCQMTLAEKRLDAAAAGPSLISVRTRHADNCFTEFVAHVCNTNSLKQLDIFPRLGGKKISIEDSCFVVMDNVLYVLGGVHLGAGKIENMFFRYEPCEDSWKQLMPMTTLRRRCSMVSLQGKLFVLGGMNNEAKILDTVEIYDPVCDTWSLGVPLPYPAYNHAATTYQGKIYISGGFVECFVLVGLESMPVETPSKQFFCFDPSKSCWIERENMNVAKGGHRGVVYRDCWYLMKGYQRVECCDLSKDAGTWTFVEFPNNLEPDACLSMDGFLYFTRITPIMDIVMIDRVVDVNQDNYEDVFSTMHEENVEYLPVLLSLSFPKFVFKHLRQARSGFL